MDPLRTGWPCWSCPAWGRQGRLPGGGVHPGTIGQKGDSGTSTHQEGNFYQKNGSQKPEVKGEVKVTPLWEQGRTRRSTPSPFVLGWGEEGQGCSRRLTRNLRTTPGPMGMRPPTFGWGLDPE